MAGDLDHLFVVIVGDQRLVGIQPLERFDRFDRVRVNDAIPDEILPLFRRKMLDLFVNGQELGHAGDVETGSGIVERLHNRGVAVGLDRIVDLHARQELSELLVVFPQHLMVHDNQRCAVLLSQLKQCLGVHRSCSIASMFLSIGILRRAGWAMRSPADFCRAALEFKCRLLP